MSTPDQEHFHPAMLVLRVVLGVGFLFVGAEKFFRLNEFIDKVASYRMPGLSYPYDEWVAYLVPCMEFMIGVCLIFRVLYRAALFLQACLVVAFAVAITHLKMNFPEVEDCGCFPWEAGHFGLHLALLATILVMVLALWQEARVLNQRRFKAGKLRLP